MNGRNPYQSDYERSILKVKKDVISGTFFMVFSAMIFLSSYSIKTNTFSQFSSSLLPRIVAALMFVLGSIEVILHWKSQEVGNSANSKQSIFQVLISILSLLIYALSIEYVGFIIMTTLLMFVQMLIISNWNFKKKIQFLVISVCSSVVFYFLFSRVFYLMLPGGILG